MSHFARIDNNNIVQEVIVAEQSFINSLSDKDSWIQASYRTHGGQHPEGKPFRKNYPGIGFTYDGKRDAFIPPRPHLSWKLDEFACVWEPPIPYPNDGKSYRWDESVQDWVSLS